MTHTTKHTPGPWKAVPDRSRNLYTWYVEGAKGVVPAIARLSIIDACEEIEGNAHLIAAAPTMYIELKALYEYCLHNIPDMSEYSGDPEQAVRMKAARATLAQAEGRHHE